MKLQDVYKLIALFLILIMVGAPLYLLFEGQSRSPTQTSKPQTIKSDFNPEYWTMNEPFYSISDALNMTPPGVESADYIDLNSMTPQMSDSIKQGTGIGLLVNQVDSIYNSTTTGMYYSRLNESGNESILLLSTMAPEKNNFDFMVSPNIYVNQYILIRQDEEFKGMINIMGRPVLFAPPQTALSVLEIITSFNKTNTSYDEYKGLLSHATNAPYQKVVKNVGFADRLYMGIRKNDSNYERTIVYENINSSTLARIIQLKAIGEDNRSFTEYNIDQKGNYTIVKIVSSDITKVINEGMT